MAKNNILRIINGKIWRGLGLKFPKMRKASPWDKYKIQISEGLYLECVKHWGNTVLNSMIAKGNLEITN